MSFTIDDTVKVMKLLNLKQSQFDFVNSKLLHVSRKSEILWQEIKTDLKTLDDLEVQLLMKIHLLERHKGSALGPW